MKEEYIIALLGGVSVLAAKIVWDWLKPSNGKQPVTQKECEIQHTSLTRQIGEMKDDQKEAFRKIDGIYDHLLKKGEK